MKRVQICSFLLLSGWATVCLAAEGRIPISEATTITTSGSYIVTNDFVINTGSAIVVNASHVTIDLDGHTIESTAATDIITNGNTGTYRDIHVKNGKLVGGNYHINFFGPGGEFSVEEVTLIPQGIRGFGILITGNSTTFTRSTIVKNTITGINGIGVQLDFVDGGRIEENNIARSTSTGINMRASTNCVVRGNSVAFNTGTGIYMQALSGIISSSNLLVDNTISDNGGHGIQLFAANTVIDRNAIARNDYGILTSTGSDGNSITSNVISGNMQDGIRLAVANNTTVQRNLVTGNALSGIGLVGARWNDISFNVSQSNLNHGIHLVSGGGFSSSYNNIDRNVLARNGDVAAECGLNFGNSAQDNNIYSNNRTLDNGTGGACTGCGICLNSSTNTDGGGNINID